MSDYCCGGPQAAEPKAEASSHALEILKERFARGEIEKAEYEEKRQIISGMQDKTAKTRGCC